MEDLTPKEVHATYSPTIETPGPSGDIPLLDIAHLWEEANKALGDWLEIKYYIDICQWKLVSKFGMTFCQNESKTEESIKEARLSAPIPSGKQRPTVPTLSRKQKPIAQQPTGRQRLGEFLKPVPFNNHMPKAFSILKSRPLKRRVKVNSTFSLPAKPPWKPVLLNLVACC